MKRVETKDSICDSLKPLFGSRGQPPFYDPNDLHSHVWHKGKLGIEDDPKVPTYSKSKINIRDCVYCKVCHTIKDSFQSTVGKNRDVVEDDFETVLKFTPKETYDFISVENNEEVKMVPLEIEKTEEEVKTKPVNERLFLNTEGIFNNYVEVTELV